MQTEKKQIEKKPISYFKTELENISQARGVYKTRGLDQTEELNKKEIEILKEFQENMEYVINFYRTERMGYALTLESDSQKELESIKARLKELLEETDPKKQPDFIKSTGFLKDFFNAIKIRRFITKMTEKSK
ncbi:MAG: hypothetical protein JW974_01035 [Alphaproteobacteria bacterium]|nr:hypothetical protein [Alphaproteobacteria bacterium]MBN2675373.1 hypothetical protein [Alphaproteobacteria bacterium]